MKTNNKKSSVNGVYYIAAKRVWMARSPDNSTLYRGESLAAAEAARREYDEKNGKPYVGKFTNVWQPTWPATTTM